MSQLQRIARGAPCTPRARRAQRRSCQPTRNGDAILRWSVRNCTGRAYTNPTVPRMCAVQLISTYESCQSEHTFVCTVHTQTLRYHVWVQLLSTYERRRSEPTLVRTGHIQTLQYHVSLYERRVANTYPMHIVPRLGAACSSCSCQYKAGHTQTPQYHVCLGAVQLVCVWARRAYEVSFEILTSKMKQC